MLLRTPILLALYGASTILAEKATLIRDFNLEAIKSFSDDYFQKVILDGIIPGAVLSIVKGEEVIYSTGYGFSNITSGLQADPEKSLLQVGSISELFTTTAILQLIESGAIESLNATANTYLREPNDKRGFRISDPGYFSNVTIENLLTHTSGLDEKFSGSFGTADEIGLDVRERFTNFPVRMRDVDTLSSYSYYNMAALGYIVSRLTHTPFPEYMKENVLSPLGMKSSTFTGFNRTDEQVQQLVQLGHHFANGYEKHAKEGVKFEPSDDLYMALLPTGGLFTTASDMSRFMMAQLNEGISQEGNRVLQKQSVEQMQAQHYSSHPLLDGVCYGYFETKYENGIRMISHAGDLFGQTSQISLFPDEKLGIFLWYNSNNLSVRKGYVERFLSHFYGVGELSSLAEYDTEYILNSEPWDSRSSQYTGVYRPTRVPVGNYEKIISIFLEATVTAGHEHDLKVKLSKDLSIYFGTSTLQLREIGKDMFEIINPSPELKSKRYVFFETISNGFFMHTGVFDVPIPFKRSKFYESANFQMYVYIVCVACFVVEVGYYSYSFLRNSGVNPDSKVDVTKPEDDAKEKLKEDAKEKAEDDVKVKKETEAEAEDELELSPQDRQFKQLPHFAGIISILQLIFLGILYNLSRTVSWKSIITQSRLPHGIRSYFILPIITQVLVLSTYLDCTSGGTHSQNIEIN
ncbi:hypothetical protein K7432_000955 [Basidiobolus ranarum]|uniref:Beta-lactamase-related domain-containing protein n=1 Tax=Basidiobolus ranarum TaxID=34480 RepID=A0ABR2WAH4_9FUNG